VLFAHDTVMNLQAAVSLVNSAGSEVPGDADTLATLEDLDDFFRRWQYSGWRARRRRDLEDIRGLRVGLRELFTASREEAVAIVNRWLAEAGAVPRLVRHDDLDWHIHPIADDAAMADRIRAETAMAMVDVIRADEMGRFSVCADDRCDGIVLDLSRNRSRRYCSTACSNRNAVAAYRARGRAR
jgi:predicted RNA-binding Zn ribbon-like protein